MTKTPKDKRANLQLALPVAAVWVAIAAIVQLFCTLVLAPQLAPAVHYMLMDFGKFSPDNYVVTANVLLTVWVIIGIGAAAVALGFAAQRRGKVEAIDAGVIVIMFLGVVMGTEVASLLFQLGYAIKPPRLTDIESLIVFLSGLGAAIVGAVTVNVVTRIHHARARRVAVLAS